VSEKRAMWSGPLVTHGAAVADWMVAKPSANTTKAGANDERSFISTQVESLKLLRRGKLMLIAVP
jgi:hypothetical protein